MNFINWLSSGASLLNFHLSSQGGIQNSLLRNHVSSAASTGFVECSKESLKRDNGCQMAGGKEVGRERISEDTKTSMPMADQNFDKQSKQLQAKLLLEQDKLLNQCLTMLTHNLQERLEGENTKNQKAQTTNKVHRKKISKSNHVCGHTDLPHYAKGMCDNCYHKNGRTKKPWKCGHTKLYACGLCQNCYANQYNKNKRLKGGKPQPQTDNPSVQQ